MSRFGKGKQDAQVSVSRRAVVKAGALGLALPSFFIGNSWAAGKTLQLLSYVGPQAEYLRKTVAPPFEKKYGCKVIITESATLATIATLRTQKGSPKFSVAMMDDLGVPIAKQEGLIQKLVPSEVANMSKVFPRFIFQDSFGIAFSISSVAPFYNNTISKPVESFADLWDPRFAGRFMMSSPKVTQSVCLLVMAASLQTGKPVEQAQYDLEAGWTKLASLKPNLQTIYESSGNAAIQLSQGQADVAGPEFSKAVYPYIVRGAPITFSHPKEGAFAGTNCVTLVNNAPERELGAAFIDHLLSTDMQKGMAEYIYAAPSVAGIELSPAVAKAVPYPADQIDKLHVLDWSKINPQRSGIVDRFNQLFGA